MFPLWRNAGQKTHERHKIIYFSVSAWLPIMQYRYQYQSVVIIQNDATTVGNGMGQYKIQVKKLYIAKVVYLLSVYRQIMDQIH
ncbi:hypothetical protein XELAEV_18013115mg [Xenopus laevis]|uniref:Uncharacterized protein n=1 Tax=Xenopus laevis TaxID=8355 RepID=A0A974DRI0_XENLA|nr:hypothetical protein XELAEV_18013115mg [Xenopus laevis]